MDKGEQSFPFEDTSELSDEEIRIFVAENIWISAEYFWGHSFRDRSKLHENNDIYTTKSAFDNDEKVALSIFLDEGLSDEFEADVNEPGMVSVTVRMSVYRDDMTDFLPKNMKEYYFWENMDYVFPLDGDEDPTVENYIVLKDKNGTEVGLDPSEEELRERIEQMFETEYRVTSLTSQHCIDIHNILLVLDVPEEFIMLP